MNEWILLRRRRWVRWENTFRGLLCNWRPPPPWKELYNFVIRIPSNMVLFSHPPTLYFTCAYSAFRSRVATRRFSMHLMHCLTFYSNYVCWSWVTLMYFFNTCVPRAKTNVNFWTRHLWMLVEKDLSLTSSEFSMRHASLSPHSLGTARSLR